MKRLLIRLLGLHSKRFLALRAARERVALDALLLAGE